MSFDAGSKTAWMSRYWHYSIYFSGAYVATIFAVQAYMRHRKPFALRKELALWNTFLAVFSILATLRTLPELIGILISPHLGFHHSVCSPCSEDLSPDSAFWAWAFVLSKVIELGDTAFIVLRKQPLIFLHWYHHVTVLIYAWYSYGDYIAPARWFVVVNYFVHSLMYTYYALKSLQFRIPNIVRMIITTLQLSQMVLGITVNVYAYRQKNQGVDCDVQYQHLNVGLAIYFSYFLLFGHFFYKAYFCRPKSPSTKSTKTTSSKPHRD